VIGLVNFCSPSGLLEVVSCFEALFSEELPVVFFRENNRQRDVVLGQLGGGLDVEEGVGLFF